MVSELLGSFGDNELSPECLDGAQSFLKSSYSPKPLKVYTLYNFYMNSVTVQLNSNLTLAYVSLAETQLILKYARVLDPSVRTCL